MKNITACCHLSETRLHIFAFVYFLIAGGTSAYSQMPSQQIVASGLEDLSKGLVFFDVNSASLICVEFGPSGSSRTAIPINGFVCAKKIPSRRQVLVAFANGKKTAILSLTGSGLWEFNEINSKDVFLLSHVVDIEFGDSLAFIAVSRDIPVGNLLRPAGEEAPTWHRSSGILVLALPAPNEPLRIDSDSVKFFRAPNDVPIIDIEVVGRFEIAVLCREIDVSKVLEGGAVSLTNLLYTVDVSELNSVWDPVTTFGAIAGSLPLDN